MTPDSPAAESGRGNHDSEGPTGLRELIADPGPDPIDRVATAVMSRQRSNGRLSTQSDRTQMREIT